MDGIPTTEQARTWVGVTESQVSDADLGAVLAAEQAIQARVLLLPADGAGVTYPEPLVRALLRRVQCHLARKNLPLGVVGGDAQEWSPVTLSAWDSEVQRLESSYLDPVVA